MIDSANIIPLIRLILAKNFPHLHLFIRSNGRGFQFTISDFSDEYIFYESATIDIGSDPNDLVAYAARRIEEARAALCKYRELRK